MRNNRIISMLLTIAMIFTFIPVTMVTTVSAAAEPEAAITLTLEAADEAKRGETVTVNVVATAETNVKLTALNFAVSYAEALELVSIANATGEGYGIANTKEGSAAYGSYAWIGNGDTVTVGTEGTPVATITFTVVDDAELGDTEITLGNKDVTKLNAKLDGESGAFVPTVAPATVEIYDEVAVTVAAGANGSIEGFTEAITVRVGDTVAVDDDEITIGETTITATANEFYTFAGWFNGTQVTDGYEIPDEDAITITANFTDNAGIVSATAGANGNVNGGAAVDAFKVTAGETITVADNVITAGETTITATANTDYKFVNWTYTVGGEPAEIPQGGVITVENGKTYAFTANFAINVYYVTAAEGENGAVDVTAKQTVPAGTATTIAGNKIIIGEDEDTVEITATADTNFKFDGWYIGDAKQADGAISYVLGNEYTLTAKFVTSVGTVTAAAGENGELTDYTAAIENIPEGTKITADNAAGTLTIGEDENIIATIGTDPADNNKFTGWTLLVDGEPAEFNGTTTVEAGKTYAFTANFGTSVGTVTLASAGNGTIDGYTAALTVPENATVTVDGANITVNGTVYTANPGNGYEFAEWKLSGEDEAFTGTQTVVAGETYTFTAYFQLATKQISVPAGVSVKVNEGEAVTEGTVDVKLGDTITITPADDVMVTGVAFNGEALAAAEGKYTVALTAENIETALAITVTKLEYEFVSAAAYGALANNDQQLLIIKSAANDKTYTLEGTNFYYSSRYEGYVAIVAAGQGADSAADIGQKITSTDEADVDEINYEYPNVNGDEYITAADAAIVSEMLHAYTGGTSTTYNDIMRLTADAYDDGTNYVTAADCMYLLYRSIGLNYPEDLPAEDPIES